MWSNCGTDSKGRDIGYGEVVECDYPGCKQVIDRGLAYACGDMHGASDISCEGHFCYNHRRIVGNEVDCFMLCFECADKMDKNQCKVTKSG